LHLLQWIFPFYQRPSPDWGVKKRIHHVYGF
jgi:hypothetical protein